MVWLFGFEKHEVSQFQFIGFEKTGKDDFGDIMIIELKNELLILALIALLIFDI